jgi:hypothetical protein
MSEADRLAEAAYFVDNSTYLHLTETAAGFQYEAFAVANPKEAITGEIGWPAVFATEIACPPDAARVLACAQIGLDGAVVMPVALSSLDRFPKSDIHRRTIWEPDTLPKNDIRFIDSHYNTLCKIPDGGVIKLDFPDEDGIPQRESITMKCAYIDDYHLRVGYNVFHICEFAERMEALHATYAPEPLLPVTQEQAAWEISGNTYLTLQTCDSGWDYSIYNKDFREMDGGQLDAPDLSIEQAREEILAANDLDTHTRTESSYEAVKNMAVLIGHEQKEAQRPSALEQLSALKNTHEKAADAKPKLSAKHKEAER